MRFLLIVILLIAAVPAGAVELTVATPAEARNVAQNWITHTIRAYGSWGTALSAELGPMQEFRRGERVIGYFFPVRPKGYIVVSLYKELATVKAYSEDSDLDPASEEGMTDIIKRGLYGMIQAVEEKAQEPQLQGVEIGKLLEIDYSARWSDLELDPAEFGRLPRISDYPGGNPPLLTTRWHQSPPYNDQCPSMGCANSNGRAIVGCTAIMMAQIMRYWHWPPYGQGGSPYSDNYYNWPNMPDSITTGSPQAQIDAVAELCYEAAIGVDTTFGCTASSAKFWAVWPVQDVSDAMEDHFRYQDNMRLKHRDDHNATEWFGMIVNELSNNRPLCYRVTNHAIVCDGWRETPNKEYHMNYGWQDAGANTWYTLDALPLGDYDEEALYINLLPVQSIGPSLGGNYAKLAFPYYYFTMDTECPGNATFSAGELLQFLPNAKATCTSTTGGSIRFTGSSADPTTLFTRGLPANGVRIYNGAIKISQNGSITLR